MKAIIYTTNTGSTERYAKFLSHETTLPAYSLAEAQKKVSAGSDVIYLGWVMAGTIKGYTKAAERYRVCAVCAVGMGQTGSQTDTVRQKNNIPPNTALFTLQGNLDIQKLHGIYRPMLKIAYKGLSQKSDRTQEEDDMLNMMLQSDEHVKSENLNEVLNWYRAE